RAVRYTRRDFYGYVVLYNRVSEAVAFDAALDDAPPRAPARGACAPYSEEALRVLELAPSAARLARDVAPGGGAAAVALGAFRLPRDFYRFLASRERFVEG